MIVGNFSLLQMAKTENMNNQSGHTDPRADPETAFGKALLDDLPSDKMSQYVKLGLISSIEYDLAGSSL